MTEGKLKSRSLRRVQLRTPSGRLTTHYYDKKSGKAQCSNCGDYLKGVPNIHQSRLHSLSKTKKRPERLFGGTLCSRCSRQAIINRFRNLFILPK